MKFKIANIIALYCTILGYCHGQDLNVVPNILKPYFWNTDQTTPINFMANISEKLFHFKKIGIQFGA